MIEVTAQGGRTRLDSTRHYNYRHFVTLSRTMADMKFLAWTLIIIYIIQIPYMHASYYCISIGIKSQLKYGTVAAGNSE